MVYWDTILMFRDFRKRGAYIYYACITGLIGALGIAVVIALGEFIVRSVPLVPDSIAMHFQVMPESEFFSPLPNDSVETLFGIENRSNRYGLRGPNRPLSKPKGVQRIALLGDSVVWGYGTEEVDGIANQLELYLNKNHQAMEVWNLGVQSSNTFNHRGRYERLAPNIHPDITYLLLLTNDLSPAATRFRITAVNTLSDPTRKPPFPDSWRPYLDRSALYQLAMRMYLARIDRSRSSPRYSMAHFKKMTDQIDAIRETARSVGSKLVVVYMPGNSLSQKLEMKLRDGLSLYGQQRGVDFIDLSEVLGSPVNPRYLLPQDSVHPNASGNLIIAQRLAQHVLPIISSISSVPSSSALLGSTREPFPKSLQAQAMITP